MLLNIDFFRLLTQLTFPWKSSTADSSFLGAGYSNVIMISSGKINKK